MDTNLLSLTREALHGEPWRLWSGHLVHWDLSHLILNVLALAPPLVILGRSKWRDAALFVLVSAPVISLGILALSDITAYRGASAIAIGLWVFVPLAQWSDAAGSERPFLALLFALAAVKLALETSGWQGFYTGEAQSLALAHVLGVTAGLAAAAVSRLVHRNATTPSLEDQR